MSRINNAIKVYNPSDTVPTDAEGGYAGGDSTAAAVGTAQAQALAAQQTIQNLQGSATTLPYGANPTVSVSGSGTSKTINIGIPLGMPADVGGDLVTAAQSAQADAAQSAADAQTALQAQFLTQDEGVAALIETSAGPETRAAGDARWARLPNTGRHPLTGWFHAIGYGLSTANTAAANDAAIAAAIAGMNTGDTLYFPAGQFKVSAKIHDAKTIHFVGVPGNFSNAGNTYGDVGWDTAPNITGTVIRYTAATGGPVITDASAWQNGMTIEHMTFIGPGSGTTTGIRLGNVGGVGYPVRPRLRNVNVANFATGIWANCENGVLDAILITSCDVGFQAAWPFNGNTVTGLNVELCNTKAIDLAGADTNAFVGGVIQGNYAPIVVALSGNCYGNTFDSMYFENLGPTVGGGFDELNIVASQFNEFRRCHFGSQASFGPRISLGAGAQRNKLAVQGLAASNVPYALNLTSSSRNHIVAAITGAVTRTMTDGNIVSSLGDEGLMFMPIGLVSGSTPQSVPDATGVLSIMTGGGVTFRLPDPTVIPPGRVYAVKNAQPGTTNKVTSLGASKTIDGAAEVTFGAWECKRFVSDGTRWLTV